ncbi:Choline Kinase Alpha [Manis pentadactyla]|nr:Choline Kinase Alpha [Manis pentadactyla]
MPACRVATWRALIFSSGKIKWCLCGSCWKSCPAPLPFLLVCRTTSPSPSVGIQFGKNEALFHHLSFKKHLQPLWKQNYIKV